MYELFFGDQRRKFVGLVSAAVASQAVAVLAVRRHNPDVYVLVSLVSFFAVFFIVAAVLRYRQLSAVNTVAPNDCAHRDAIEIFETTFHCIYDDEFSRLVRHKRVAITGAAEDVVGALTRDIARLQPASILFLDDDLRYLRSRLRIVQRVSPSTKTLSLAGSLTDAHWLDAALSEHAPEVLVDAAVYRYLRSKTVDPGNAESADLPRATKVFFERAEAVVNLAEVWSKQRQIQSVLLPLPRRRSGDAKGNWDTFYATCLQSSARQVGVHVADDDAVVSVWQPLHAH